VNAVDPALLGGLVATVQDSLSREAARRVQAGEAALVGMTAEVFADSICRRELAQLDTDRIRRGAVRLTTVEENDLIDQVLARATGVGPVQLVLADPSVEEIVATRWDLVFVYRSGRPAEMLTEPLWTSEADMERWLSHLARTAGRTERSFNAATPMLVMRIGEGLRLAATRDISQNVSFALRRNVLGKTTLDDLVSRDMLSDVLADLLRACMNSTELRLVVSGATGAGKSTVVRACLAELPPHARVVIIEDTAELDLFDMTAHPNVESWEERLANSEGEGAVTQGQAVKHALRYRPDWLVCGEVRDSDAAVPMLKAMTHGQSSLTTVHAQSAPGALDKLALYLGTGDDQIPAQIAHHQLWQAIDFVVHVDRDVDGIRHVAEIIEVAGYDGERVMVNSLYDHAGGRRTMQRLTDRHSAMLERAGFDPGRLGSGWR
jgi:pilus assembly protein CpaF